MAIKVKREEIQLEEELASKLKEFGLEFEMPIDEEDEDEEKADNE